LGLYCLLVFLLFSVLVDFYPTMFQRREKILFFAIIFLSLYLTRSRNSIVSVIIFYLFMYLYKFSPFLGFIIFIIFIFLYQFIIDNLPLIVIYFGLQDYFRIDTLSTGSGRLIAWNFAWENIQKNFFIGKGISYTEYLYKKNYVYLANLGHQGNAHNSYLTLWLDTGLIGLVLYLFGFVSLFVKAAMRTRMAMPIMYAILFSVFFESWLTASLNPLTIVLLTIITIIASDNIEIDTNNDFVEEQLDSDLQAVES
jgi:O-antigen ligase